MKYYIYIYIYIYMCVCILIFYLAKVLFNNFYSADNNILLDKYNQ
jgi:hypothetical protein